MILLDPNLPDSSGTETCQRIHPQDLARHDRALQESMERCEDYACEFRVVWADGSVHRVEAPGQYVYLKSEDGLLLRMRGVLSDIDSRKRAEEALRESEALLNAFIRNTPAGLVIYTDDNRYVRASNYAANLYGLPAEALVGKSITEVLPPDLAQATEKRNREVLETNRPAATGVYSAKLPLRSPEAKITYWQGLRFPVPLPGGKTGVGVVNIDVTEQMRAEEALRQSEDQLRVAATAAEIGMWHWTPGTNDVVVTANWRRLFGVREDAPVTFETWRNALHPEDRDHAVRELNAAAEEHREFNVEYRVVRPDGTTCWIVDRGRGSYDASGRPIHMAGVNVDITARKQAEEALRQSEKRLRRILAASPMGAVLAYEDGRISEANDAYLRLIGYRREDLQAGRIQWDRITPPEYLSRDAKAIAEAKAKGVSLVPIQA